MANVHGMVGNVKIGASSVTDIEEWSGTYINNFVDKNVLQASSTNQVAGQHSMTGTIRVLYDSSDANGQVAMMTAVTGGTSVLLRLYEDAAGNFNFAAHLEMEGGASGTDIVKRTYNFRNAGDVTFTGP